MGRKYIFQVIGLILLVGAVILVRESNLGTFFQTEKLKALVVSFDMYAPLLYIGFYAVASVLFIPGSPITLAGGALFGPLYGTLYTIIGATLGATGGFILSRFIGGTFFSQKTGDVTSKLQSYNEKIKEHGFVTVLFLRFVPLFPFNGLNFGLGLTKVSFKDYFFGTFFGIIPGTFAYVYFGDSLASLNPVKIVGAIVFILILSVAGKLFLQKSTTTSTKN